MHPRTPAVTFVVPCYKLAHFLRECVDSILDQEYKDLEVLIMDDCSPDDTAAVAETFRDPRVRYVRNPVNLGHLHNFNRGIDLARGRYLWLISADDRLRSRTALGKLVTLLDSHPDMSFAFSPGHFLSADGIEGGTQGGWGVSDRIFTSAEFFERLIRGNDICTPGALSRKASYYRAGLFPPGLPYAGDWYLWLRFSLMGPVGYNPDPGVHYRQHAGSNTAIYTARRDAVITRDEVEVRWRIRPHAGEAGGPRLLHACDEAIAWDYARRTFEGSTGASHFGLTPEEVQGSIGEHGRDSQSSRRMQSRYCELVGDLYEQAGDRTCARGWYIRSMAGMPWSAAVLAKLALTGLGSRGTWVRRVVSTCKATAGRLVSRRVESVAAADMVNVASR